VEGRFSRDRRGCFDFKLQGMLSYTTSSNRVALRRPKSTRSWFTFKFTVKQVIVVGGLFLSVTVVILLKRLLNQVAQQQHDHEQQQLLQVNAAKKKERQRARAQEIVLFHDFSNDKKVMKERITSNNNHKVSRQEEDSGTSSTMIWESSSTLPQWMKDYFVWHKQQRTLLQETWKPLLQGMNQPEAAARFYNNSNNHRFLILRCFSCDKTCGGLADRLLPLPYLLQVAHNSSRLLLIHYERPAPLTNYLVPPRGGMDWRIPSWLLPAFNFTVDTNNSNNNKQQRSYYKSVEKLEHHVQDNPNEITIQSILQVWHYGSQPYNQRRNTHDNTKEFKFKHVVRDVWRVLFTPTIPLQTKINTALASLGLIEGHYTSLHLRVLYGIQNDERTLADTIKWTRNAIHCASQLMMRHAHSNTGGSMLFVASDSMQAKLEAVHYGHQLRALSVPRPQQPTATADNKNNNNNNNTALATIQIVTRFDQNNNNNNNNKSPNHFDREPVRIMGGTAAAVTYEKAFDYDDTYIDLYLLAMGQCVSYGIGGYGKLASFLSHNVECFNLHFKKRIMQECPWAGHDASNTSRIILDATDNDNAPTTTTRIQMLPSLLTTPMDNS
jgi:hypothetical protein